MITSSRIICREQDRTAIISFAQEPRVIEITRPSSTAGCNCVLAEARDIFDERQMILAVHIVSVGTWLGCVLTEALFEHALLGTGRANELILAKLHKEVDLFVEIPPL